MIFALKSFFRDRVTAFWNFVWPIILLTIFYLIFGNINLKDIQVPVAIHVQSPAQMAFLEGGEFAEKFMVPEDEVGMELLEKGDVKGYFDKEGHLFVNGTGEDEQLLRETMVIGTRYMTLYQQGFQGEANALTRNMERKFSFSMMYYFSVLSMVSFYGIFGGIDITTRMQANLSPMAARFNISPRKKLQSLLENLLIAFMLLLIPILFAFLYIRLVLGVDLIEAYFHSILLLSASGVFSLGLGLMTVYLGNLKEDVKVGIGTVIMLFFSFTSGMLSDGLRNVIVRYLPFFQKINPLGIVTDELMMINCVGISSTFYTHVAALFLIGLLFMGLALLKIRRNTYASL